MDETHPGPPYRSGGNLSIFSFDDHGSEVKHQGVIDQPWILNYVWHYTGGFICNYRIRDFDVVLTSANLASEANAPGTVFPSRTNADAYGATGWNRFAPGNPTADLGVFVGEIRDVPRMLLDTARFFQNAWKAIGGTLKKPSKALAGHWLSLQFGWLPFVNDLRRFYKTYRNLESQIQRIKTRNGQWHRVGGTVLNQVDEVTMGTSATLTAHWPCPTSHFLANPAISGSHTARYVLSQRVWFEGAFRYWIPDIDSPQWRYRAIAELYGAMPNPALIWELTPFSWLVDWVSNVGDVLANLDTGYAQNLTARYAYSMKEYLLQGEVESTLALKAGILYGLWKFPVSWKTRVGASRFGFGLTDADFSARQWAILAAIAKQGKFDSFARKW